MIVVQIDNYIDDKHKCFLIKYCTAGNFSELEKNFNIIDHWLEKNSKHFIHDCTDTFDVYVVLEEEQSMLFKLRYSSDK